MIIQLGKANQRPYGKWDDDARVFISQPYFKIALNNGLGVYILNAFKFHTILKCYGVFRKTSWELGVSFVGWTFELMWNEAFAK